MTIPIALNVIRNAGDELVLAGRQMIGAEMKRIRRKLHLTQKETVQLLSGGGHNAFSRYERGELTATQSVGAADAPAGSSPSPARRYTHHGRRRRLARLLTAHRPQGTRNPHRFLTPKKQTRHKAGFDFTHKPINAKSDSRTTSSDHSADYRRSHSAPPVQRFRPCP